jgi:hypothetical protein
MSTDFVRVIVCIPCLLLGGSELATLSLARALGGGGYDVTICCYYEHDAAMEKRFRSIITDLRHGQELAGVKLCRVVAHI